MDCILCGKSFNVNRYFLIHLSKKHAIKAVDYYIKYENFKIPKCHCCNESASHKNGLTFRKTCGSPDCLQKIKSEYSASEQTKEKIRKARLRYLKEHPENTAWRLNGGMSYPEKRFLHYIKLLGLNDTYDIVREYCVFPYYIDFAFINELVAIEIDGSQHNQPERKESDRKKDTLLQENGWRVYRVTAAQILSDVYSVIDDIINFVGLPNSLFKTCELVTHKELKKIRRESKKKEREEKHIQNTAKLTTSRLEMISDVDTTRHGWVTLVAKIWGVSHTQVRRWFLKYYPDKIIKTRRLPII